MDTSDRLEPWIAARRESGEWPLDDRPYLHWDDLRHREPPQGLRVEDWWSLLKLQRIFQQRPLPLKTEAGATFRYGLVDPVLEGLRFVDSHLAGAVVLSEEVTNAETRDRFIVSSLIEEAITSSQLEGAATTSAVAKEMIRSGRAPRTRDERMILNNYRAMQLVREDLNEPLSRKRLMEVHRQIVEGTIDPPDAAGRVRRADEDVKVRDLETLEVVHVPPPANLLDARLEQFCKFANGGTPSGYLHPVVRAIVLHYWLAYDHPFVDGNGRTARAIFYRELLRQGYWLGEFLSISTVLRRAPGPYARAFQLVETDERDVTYFLLHQLDVLHKAHDLLRQFLARKQSELRETEMLLRHRTDLNHRQLAVVGHALRHPRAEYTVSSHQTSHRIAYDTARLDLLTLEKLGWLEGRKLGRKIAYHPVPGLDRRLGRGRPKREPKP